MLLQGIVLLVAGIGIVFAFLSLLVAVMLVSAKIIPRFNHILPDESPSGKKAARGRAAKPGDDAIAVAIAAAILRQRQTA